ncbi:hypothetical protein CLAFUW4_08772 [Fulvia fulva]|uniref:Transmembrane protein n=1 Tax=Passalora fulva TaxID=5499 RepID=A0A9Q8PGW2_PASFU|nr:uncharacterized protein CLAFUR5_08872 [Fulvia fulva]KAK4614238.1 hypothetical protein CLAFUR4_08777 [Fulvia fulva]KAK4614813.1 hypothetical protein CLAFUR0_08772 [Fulvia fulva]UJO22177.1 hypothetical protein CLAFUR5_08872 [Fulvia fulva]WPV19914.1 hypothetical protein CLAFUW4_08772 [Fulvia fulva]WPV35138.1 hypothetical protein CLAFUW7_08772 [Fulvia fulva]
MTTTISATTIINGTSSAQPSLTPVPSAVSSSPIPIGYVVVGTVYISILALLFCAVTVFWVGMKIVLAIDRYKAHKVRKAEDIENRVVTETVRRRMPGRLIRRLRRRSERSYARKVVVEIEMQPVQSDSGPDHDDGRQRSLYPMRALHTEKRPHLTHPDRNSTCDSQHSIHDNSHFVELVEVPVDVTVDIAAWWQSGYSTK